MNMEHGTLIKESLKRLSESGKVLGNPRLAEVRHLAHQANHNASVAYVARVMKYVEEIQAAGVVTQEGIAGCLNARGIKTARGKTFSQATVCYIMRKSREHKNTPK